MEDPAIRVQCGIERLSTRSTAIGAASCGPPATERPPKPGAVGTWGTFPSKTLPFAEVVRRGQLAAPMWLVMVKVTLVDILPFA